jgi:hypothetical protein
MNQLPRPQGPLPALGMLSFVLGIISLMLFFLPILGLPIAAFALLAGILGTALALSGTGGTLRWALFGSVMSALALGVNLAIAYAPGGYTPQLGAPRLWQEVSADRPYIPPPARPGGDRAPP